MGIVDQRRFAVLLCSDLATADVNVTVLPVGAMVANPAWRVARRGDVQVAGIAVNLEIAPAIVDNQIVVDVKVGIVKVFVFSGNFHHPPIG